MQIDKKKLERQQVGIDKWFTSSEYSATKDKQGTLHWFTGVGKTYAAILVIKRLFRLNPIHNIVVLVPSEALLFQWRKELEKHFTKKQLNLISVMTPYYVIVNNLKIKTNTLICDELHEYYSIEFIKVINGEYIRFDNNLGLTATYEDSKKRQNLIKVLYPIIDEITEEEAIREGYISAYIEFNLSIELTEKEQSQYDYYSKLISENINKFGKNSLDLATKCLSGGIHNDGKFYPNSHYVYAWAGHKGWHKNLNLKDARDLQINDIWNPHKIYGYAVKLMNNIRLRKDLLYNCESKITTSLNIVHKLPDLKTIIFSQSTAFADKMNLYLNDNKSNSSVVYHSNLTTQLLPSPKTGKLIKYGKTRLKRDAIRKITTGEANVICTASSLDKGFDVQDISLGITASGTSNFTQYKQRGGRVKRKDIFNVSNVVLLVNLYVKDTKDEIWLKKRQSKSNHKLHWISSVDEISFTPKDKEEFTNNDI